MQTVNISELKNNLSALLIRVRAGEEIIIKDRDLPIARIAPLVVGEDYDAEEKELVASGLLIPPKKKWTKKDWAAFDKLPLPKVSDGAVADALDWVRGDRI